MPGPLQLLVRFSVLSIAAFALVLPLVAAAAAAQETLPLVQGGTAAVNRQEGRQTDVEVFVGSADGKLLALRLRGPARTWSDEGTPPGTTLASSPAAIGWLAGAVARVNVFATSDNGRLVERSWDGARWSWTDHGRPPSPALDSRPSGGAVGESETPSGVTWELGATRRFNFFLRTIDGRLVERWWDGSRWSWTDHGRPGSTSLATAPFALARQVPGTIPRGAFLHVFLASEDGRLVERFWDGRLWTWTDHGLGPAGQRFRGPGAGFAWRLGTTDRVNFFLAGDDGHLVERWWDGTSWRWSDHGLPPGRNRDGTPTRAAGGLAAAAWRQEAADRFHVFFLGSNGDLGERWWDGATWQWREHARPDPRASLVGAPGAVVERRENAVRLHVFLTHAHGGLLQRSWDGREWSWSQLGPADRPSEPERHEVAAPRVADDPALPGGVFAAPPSQEGPGPPPEARGEPSFDLDQRTTWSPEVRRRLAPRQSHQVSLALTRRSELVLARVIWDGGSGPVNLRIAQGGRNLARGTVLRVPPGRGSTEAQARPRGTGRATVTIVNAGNTPVEVILTIGVLNRSATR